MTAYLARRCYWLMGALGLEYLLEEMSRKTRRGSADYWDQIARLTVDRLFCPPLVEHRKRVIMGLVAQWGSIRDSSRVLKTDLFEEAFHSGQILFDLAKVNRNVVGIDVSDAIVSRARARSREHGPDVGHYVCCDVRRLPFPSDSIDLIISHSTLDHFPDESDIFAALKELGRVLCSGGTLILTIDNKSNLTYPPYFVMRLWMALGLSPFFIGRTYSLNELKSRLDSVGLSVEEATAIGHYPHPEALVAGTVRLLHSVRRGRLDGKISASLDFLERLGMMRTRFLTGRYLAVKAVKG